jgi:hypothetical protein
MKISLEFTSIEIIAFPLNDSSKLLGNWDAFVHILICNIPLKHKIFKASQYLDYLQLVSSPLER